VAEDLTGAHDDDPLAERDVEFIRATLPLHSALADVYFRPKIRGLEHIPPEGPVLLVGNHSGGTLIADTFAFAYAFYEYFGPERQFHQLAHDLVFKVPGLGFLRKYGTVPASHENAQRALDRGAALLVYPGGDFDSYRPSSESAQVKFGGRSGFVRLALEAGVPIVPVVAIGGQETALFVTRGERLARLLALDRLFRLKVLPVQFAPPFGVTVLDLPFRLPLPAQITVQVLPALELRDRFGPDPDEEAVYAAVTEQMQMALDRLAEERDLPVVGAVGPREESAQAMDAVVERSREAGRSRVEVHEPWRGYDAMRVPEVAKRLKGKTRAELLTVRGYEEAHKARAGVMKAVERELARA
jgi:1-acyl-sn-glycerol-3-phosphate acyltransferase